jgi:hypothetical protein
LSSATICIEYQASVAETNQVQFGADAFLTGSNVPEKLFLFLVRASFADPPDWPLLLPGDAHMVEQGLFLVRSDLSRSRLYHQIKRYVPRDTPLLVVRLAEAPKFKNMNTGTLSWLRRGKVPG